jgi:hypothetical protein
LQYQRGEISLADLTKRLFIYCVLNSYLYAFATSLSPLLLFNDDDDDDRLFWKDVILSLFDVALGSVPLLGQVLSDAGNMAYEGFVNGKFKKPPVMKTPLVNDMLDGFGKIADMAENGITFIDLVEAVSPFVETAAGVPLKTIVNEGAGLIDIMKGTFTGEPKTAAKGALQAAGYSRRKAKKISA